MWDSGIASDSCEAHGPAPEAAVAAMSKVNRIDAAGPIASSGDERPTSSALEKELFWRALKQRKVSLNDRQARVLNILFSGFEGKLTRDKWMKMTKSSSRTALRDIEELIALGVIEQEEAGGRSASYRLNRIVEHAEDRK
jgi:hypothetical protein